MTDERPVDDDPAVADIRQGDDDRAEGGSGDVGVTQAPADDGAPVADAADAPLVGAGVDAGADDEVDPVALKIAEDGSNEDPPV